MHITAKTFAVGALGALAVGQLLLAQTPTIAQQARTADMETAQPVQRVTMQAKQRVQPGLVRWHPGREQAQAAAIVSGKPVLLFQMLGRLDELFC